MFGKLCGWLFGKFHSPGNIDELYYSINPHNGRKEWFKNSVRDCMICGAPGFECDNTNNCRYCH